MNALTTTPADSPPIALSNREAQQSSTSQAPRAFNGYFVIIPLATALALLTALECGGSILHPASLVYGAVLWGWWAVFACVLGRLAPHLPLVSNLSVKGVLSHLAIGSALALSHLYFLWAIGFPLGWGPEGSKFMWGYLFNINRFGIEYLIYGFIIGITGVLQYQLRAQRESMRSLELEKQLSTAHLRALQAQLEPHFLFNTLNAITTLVELGRQQQAVEILFHLNAILKSTLKRTTPEKVPLAQELEMIDNYLSIEQVRFADRLRVEIKVDPGALDGLVPCFLLQPIVENAIRHGIAPSINEGIVVASARREGSTLHLRVRDTGSGGGESDPGMPTDTDTASIVVRTHDGHGIGLRNTRERLVHFYQENFQMRAEPHSEGGFEVAISIPYESVSR
ncbi:sensor histidine kinase [Tunturiibacter gelidoferens]|jgi:Histidine kinase|uniref:Signal transduction histidine kinase n=1 Tax=Tunturiibacter gelidiferens TaxID=3069689 RepID=A0A9X0QID6_9BACT|nr:histidine kinase [Edaphobacter lichenicola]MBB5330890.1 signal transduction histidine kinase [Edaphobacter lichenicola]